MTIGEKPASKLDFARVMPIFVLVFVDVLGLTVILPLLHLYAAAYGATPVQIGLVAAAFPLAQLVGVPMMGALSDRFGRKPLLLISQITTCASFIMLGMANSLQLIILSRVIDGLFGANIATAQAALSDITDDSNRTQGLGLTGAAFGLGFIFGPITALLTLEISDSLALPALTAAGYSFISILLTLFVFKETLPPEKRGTDTGRRSVNPFLLLKYLTQPTMGVLLLLMFAQQLIFFGFETLLGLFTLTRLGLMGGGNAYIFIVIGLTLVLVQVRFIGKWSRRYGEHRLVQFALGLLAVGLVLMAFTPRQPHVFYVKMNVEYDLREQVVSSTEAIVGDLNITLPEENNRGIFGVLWVFVMVIPLSIGAGLIRPSLNSIMTKRVGKQEYGSILGVSSAVVSAANATAPLFDGWLFQHYGSTVPFLLGGVLMGVLALLSLLLVKPISTQSMEA
jgi:DHA1 family tetracycline resistance protein-like MFS transporter